MKVSSDERRLLKAYRAMREGQLAKGYGPVGIWLGLASYKDAGDDGHVNVTLQRMLGKGETPERENEVSQTIDRLLCDLLQRGE